MLSSQKTRPEPAKGIFFKHPKLVHWVLLPFLVAATVYNYSNCTAKLHCFVKVDQFALVVVIVYQFPTQTCLAGFNIETASYFFHYGWAFYQLFINFYQFVYQLVINFYQLFYQRSINFIIFYQLFINFLSTFYQLLSTFFISTFYLFFYQRFINILSTFYQLLSTFLYQLFIFFLSTFYQHFINFINFLSTFNCFGFMSYISALPNIIFALHSLWSIDQSTFASYVLVLPNSGPLLLQPTCTWTWFSSLFIHIVWCIHPNSLWRATGYPCVICNQWSSTHQQAGQPVLQ